MSELIYRGVPGPQTKRDAEAMTGVATPRGSRLDAEALTKHVRGEDIDAGVTSWTTDRNVAKRFAGTMIILELPRAAVAGREVARPRVPKYLDESEILIKGRLEGARPTRP